MSPRDPHHPSPWRSSARLSWPPCWPCNQRGVFLLGSSIIITEDIYQKILNLDDYDDDDDDDDDGGDGDNADADADGDDDDDDDDDDDGDGGDGDNADADADDDDDDDY